MQKMSKKRIFKKILSWSGLFFFGLAAFMIYNQLSKYSLEEIKNAISESISSNGPCTIKQMGAIIKYVKSKFDNVDGALTSKLVKESLS